MLDRRALIVSGLAASAPPALAAPPRDPFAAIEARLGGRVGVLALDTGSGRRIGHRVDERFPMCSAFKWLLAAGVLARVDAGRERLERRIAYGPRDLLGNSPTTRAHLAEGGLSVAALCEAAITVSDNGAANLLLKTVGGPQGLTRWIRGAGDPSTRFDRYEMALNSSLPGDPRDTSTPTAMVGDLQRIVLGEVLQVASRERLTGWLVANKTGDARLRAGLPRDWRIGDKTGTSADEAATANDVAIAWPPRGKPIVIAAFLTRGHTDAKARDAAHAEIGRIVAAEFGGAR